MTVALVIATYIAVLTLSVYAISRIDVSKPTFVDGIQVGLLYYIMIPMVFILLDGSMSGQFILAAPYYPYSDLETTFVLMFGAACVSVFHIFHRPPARRTATATKLALTKFDPFLIPASVTILIATSIAGFFMTGLHLGGHWHDNSAAALQSSGSTLLIKHASNVMRTAIFGILLYRYVNRGITAKHAIIVGASVVMFDLFVTFNRITAVYFLILVFFILRRRILVCLGVSAVAIFGLSTFSNMWPMFRGLALVRGYNFDGISSAAVTAFQMSTRHSKLSDTTNGIFESINIVTLNYIVKHTGETIPFQDGAILVRPLTFFLPTMLWPDRPPGFGVQLGTTINNAKGLALNSTIFGEPFANFGHAWPIFFLPLLYIYSRIFSAMTVRWPPAGFIGFFCAIAMWRFDSVFGAISLTVVAMAYLALSFFSAQTKSSGIHTAVVARLGRPR